MLKRKIINDPVYDGFLSIDDPVILQVIEHPYFQRQRRIKQLGLTYLLDFAHGHVVHTTGCCSADAVLLSCYKWIVEEQGL